MSNTVPNNVNIYQDTPNNVTVDQDSPNLVVVRSTSASGVYTRRYVYTQTLASSEWVITHSLGGRPSVTVVDSAGTVVIGEVQYDSNTQVTVSFTVPFSGFAYLT
jgi:hypothetical protein